VKSEQRLGLLLRQQGWTLSTAESCTGGRLAARITAIPGASAYFLGGIVAYDNQYKTRLLGVPLTTLEQYGAVSSETAQAMAEGGRRVFASDLSVGITGIAGPSGGTADKPVGLVYIAIAGGGNTCATCFVFAGDRSAVQRQAVTSALDLLLSRLSVTDSKPPLPGHRP